MSAFPFLIDLGESHLIPSRKLIKNWKVNKLAELCYLYFIGLFILLANHGTKKWARDYCSSVADQNDFLKWRTNGNDLYVMLYALSSDELDAKDAKSLDRLNISPSIIRHWLRHTITHDDDEDTHRFLMRIDNMFQITNSPMKAIRRIVTLWHDTDVTERHDVIIKLIKLIHDRAPANSELLPQLKSLATEMHESASAGATGAASVATAIGGLGAGFDPAGDHGIYTKKKPVMLRRRAI